MGKFTPGPWRWVKRDDDFVELESEEKKANVFAKDGYIHPTVLDSRASCQTCEIDVEDADANLIAAAPEMYETLKIAADWMEWWLGEDYCDCGEGSHACGKHEREKELKLIQAALDKAEGSEQ